MLLSFTGKWCVAMSQKLVYELLKDLGGTASSKQIREFAKMKYPELSLYTYVTNRLNRLRKWGYVRKNPDGTWSITDMRRRFE